MSERDDRKPLPRPVYGCKHEGCAEDQSWPATDLWWSDAADGFVCDYCFCDDPMHGGESPGISLHDELQARADLAAERERELVEALRECKSYMIADHDSQGARVSANDLLIRLGYEP